MDRAFDRNTEGDRERVLLETIRSGTLDPEEVPSHCLPFFLKVQIQTVSRCNARCFMCPWPETARTQPQGTMPEPLFRHIVAQLPGQGVERVSLFLMNEPLLDARLETRTAYLKEVVPDTRAVLFTNGLLLTGERAEALAGSGLDEINVSVVGFTPEDYRRNMGVDGLERLFQNLAAVCESRQAGRLGGMRIQIVTLDLPQVRAGLETFQNRFGLPVFVKPVTNRAGNIALHGRPSQEAEAGNIAPHGPSSQEAEAGNVAPHGPSSQEAEAGAAGPARFRACQRPFVKAYILYNGDLVLCNCDWRRTTVIGNAGEESLVDIWQGPRLMEIRRQHVRGRFPEDALCARCDYPYVR